jgi:hypothetical protein
MMTLEKWLKLVILLILFGIMLKCLSVLSESETKIKTEQENKKKQKCNDKCVSKNNSTCTSNGCDKLLPVLDPKFNMREICKQSILLEDHLFQEEKRCYDCICKHFLTIEGLAEEAITLDKEQKYPELNDLPKQIRTIEKKFLENKDKNHIQAAQELREIRKKYMQQCFDAF